MKNNMKIKLSYKFFMAFLLTSVISIVLMVIIMDFYLHKNFVGFVNKMEMEILNDLDNRLRVEYKAEQGWDRLRNNHHLWERLLRTIHDSKDFERSPPDFRRKVERKRRVGPFRRLA